MVIRLDGLVTWTHYPLAFLFILLFFYFLYAQLPRDYLYQANNLTFLPDNVLCASYSYKEFMGSISLIQSVIIGSSTKGF